MTLTGSAAAAAVATTAAVAAMEIRTPIIPCRTVPIHTHSLSYHLIIPLKHLLPLYSHTHYHAILFSIPPSSFIPIIPITLHTYRILQTHFLSLSFHHPYSLSPGSFTCYPCRPHQSLAPFLSRFHHLSRECSLIEPHTIILITLCILYPSYTPRPRSQPSSH